MTQEGKIADRLTECDDVTASVMNERVSWARWEKGKRNAVVDAACR